MARPRTKPEPVPKEYLTITDGRAEVDGKQYVTIQKAIEITGQTAWAIRAHIMTGDIGDVLKVPSPTAGRVMLIPAEWCDANRGQTVDWENTYSVNEAREVLNVSRWRIDLMIKRKQLHPIRSKRLKNYVVRFAKMEVDGLRAQRLRDSQQNNNNTQEAE